jgi:hypothetical protein
MMEEEESAEEKKNLQNMSLQYTVLRGKLDRALGKPVLAS